MNPVARNLSTLLMTQLGTWLVSAAMLVVVPRYLGDEAFGQLMFAFVYVAFFELVALFGTGTFLIKQVAREPEQLGRYAANGAALGTVWAGLLALAAIALALALGFPRTTLELVAVFSLGMFLNAVTSPLIAGLHGVQRMARPAFWLLVRSYVASITGLVVLVASGSVVAYAFVLNVANVIPLVAALVTLWPHLRRSRPFELPLWRTIMVGGSPFFVSSALLMVHGRVDIPMLQWLSNDQTVGWYALAYQWVATPALFAVAVSTAFFPALSAQGQALTPTFIQMANGALRLVMFVAAPAALGIALVADQMLHLVYGPEFDPSIVLVQILAIHIPLVGMNVLLSTIAISADRQRKVVKIGLAAAVFNPVANLVAIPLAARLLGNAAIGAAVVTVVTEVILVTGFLLLRPRGVLDRPTAIRLARIGLAALAMVPPVVLLDDAALLLRIGAGVLGYGLASIVLKTFSPFELQRGVDALRRGRNRPPVEATL